MRTETPLWALTFALAFSLVLALSSTGCGDDDDGGGETTAEAPGAGQAGSTGTADPGNGDDPEPAGGDTLSPGEVPADLPNALMLSYAQFIVEDGQLTPNPGPARLGILRRSGGEWQMETIEDESAIVFHKAMVFESETVPAGIVTLSGTRPVREGASDDEAMVRIWRRSGGEWSAETLWSAKFGGRINRMRDAEIADVFGDGRPDIAVGTHDQGVFTMLRPPAEAGGDWQVQELDRRDQATFIHEIEIGDMDGDGTLEVYATPSEPNTLEGHEQRGEVVRYVPKDGEGRTVVADLGNRHAKEIYVGDVDGDGRDELYVAVEALTEGRDPNVTVVEPVEIRRYDADTPPDQGVVIATINDRFCRFLTVGDVDGDGKKEMVAASYSSGLWLLQPGRDPRGEWSIESIDRDSSGFEHASIFADLDGDGSDELYVAADRQGELRRYVWVNGRPQRSVIHSRAIPRSMMTWNINPIPVSMLQ